MNPAKRSIIFLIWLMMMVAYFDRIVIAVAGPAIRTSLDLSKSQFGFVLSAFTLGYALMQVPGGYLADRFGSRRLLVVALLVWSAFTGLTGLVWSLVVLLVVRMLFGFGEGIENGAQFKLIGDHFSSRERSMATAIFLTSLALGPAVATPAATWLIATVGWRATFYGFGLPGLIVAFLLFRFLPVESGDVGERGFRIPPEGEMSGANRDEPGERDQAVFAKSPIGVGACPP
jgi:MFS family permease